MLDDEQSMVQKIADRYSVQPGPKQISGPYSPKWNAILRPNNNASNGGNDSCRSFNTRLLKKAEDIIERLQNRNQDDRSKSPINHHVQLKSSIIEAMPQRPVSTFTARQHSPTINVSVTPKTS